MKKTGIYVHIPFCIKKCNYCDFCSFDNKSAEIQEYCQALFLEIENFAPKLKDYSADTIYIGGGTPTSVDVKYIKELLSVIKNNINVLRDAEITIEANPKTCTFDGFAELYASGVNRISLGAQSFSDSELSLLGRAHNSDDIIKSCAMLKKAGFKNFNLDIMFGIPNQTIKSLEKTISSVLLQNPTHISAYSLIIEEGTPFYNCKTLNLPTEDTEREMYDLVISTLSENNYRHYEISNFSLENYESRHNLKYWDLKSYVGFGLNAHSFFEGCRFYNTSDLYDYIKYPQKSLCNQKIETEDLVGEFIMLGLRKIGGINKEDFFRRFNIDIYDKFKKELMLHIGNGLLLDDGENIKLSRKGIDVSNYVMKDFI